MIGRPKEYDDAAVINAAMDVFWENGYEASSTQVLCERTGLGKGSLYHAFGSKQELYEQALRHYQELGITAQTRILNGPGSAKDRLRALLQWGVEGDMDSTQPHGCMALFSVMERSSKDPAVESINRAYVCRLESALAEVISEGQKNGDINADRPASSVARAFLASYYGLRILGQSMPDRAFLDDVLNATMAKF
ncbi:TetR/AcrR family transcriptional regulator [Paenalcaligenes sp. Me131]|uniref:TetR/AcrR family transcriptional regulator n=1 Tax=Paenalcaligenes sp. Me131 TaxID=3392636 RepID=UPI003D2B9C85